MYRKIYVIHYTIICIYILINNLWINQLNLIHHKDVDIKYLH